jgi:hypothetical protein
MEKFREEDDQYASTLCKISETKEKFKDYNGAKLGYLKALEI